MGGSNALKKADLAAVDQKTTDAIWAQYDTDKSDVLEEKEYKKFVVDLFNKVVGVLAPVFAKALEKTEAEVKKDFEERKEDFIKELTEKLDTDADGKVTKAEFTKGFAAVSKQMIGLDEYTAQTNAPDTVYNKYKTYEGDCAIGQKFPTLENLEWTKEAKAYQLPTKGKPFVCVVWAQFSKSGYKFMPLYSELLKKFDGFISVFGLSVDPAMKNVEKFLADPGKKYSTVFNTEFPQAWDGKKTVKEKLGPVLRGAVSLVHCFIVDKDNTIVWRQDHSQIGATAPNYMEQITRQVGLLLTGKALETNGPNPKPEESDEDEDEDESDEE